MINRMDRISLIKGENPRESAIMWNQLRLGKVWFDPSIRKDEGSDRNTITTSANQPLQRIIHWSASSFSRL
jgi:hypothetical protein